MTGLDPPREQEGEAARPNQMMFATIVKRKGIGAAIALNEKTKRKRTLLRVKRILEGEPSLLNRSRSHTIF